MKRLIRWLLLLYPRSWRNRYGDELLAVVDQHRSSLKDVLDVARAALSERIDQATGRLVMVNARSAISIIFWQGLYFGALFGLTATVLGSTYTYLLHQGMNHDWAGWSTFSKVWNEGFQVIFLLTMTTVGFRVTRRTGRLAAGSISGPVTALVGISLYVIAILITTALYVPGELNNFGRIASAFFGFRPFGFATAFAATGAAISHSVVWYRGSQSS